MKKLLFTLMFAVTVTAIQAQQKSLPLFKMFENYPCPTSNKYDYNQAMKLGQQLAKDGKAILVYTPVTESGYYGYQCPGVRDELINVHHVAGVPISGFTNGDGIFLNILPDNMKNPPVMDTAWHNTTTYTYDGKQLVIKTKISRSKRISKGYKLRYIAIDSTGKALNYFQSEWFGANPYNNIPAKKANNVFRKTVTLDFETKVPFKIISFIEDWRLPNVSTNYAKPTVNAVIARKVKQ